MSSHYEKNFLRLIELPSLHSNLNKYLYKCILYIKIRRLQKYKYNKIKESAQYVCCYYFGRYKDEAILNRTYCFKGVFSFHCIIFVHIFFKSKYILLYKYLGRCWQNCRQNRELACGLFSYQKF